MSWEIKVERTGTPKAKPDQNNLGFGDYFSDHMFIMDYTEGKGWHDPRIAPYAPWLWILQLWYCIMVRPYLKD